MFKKAISVIMAIIMLAGMTVVAAVPVYGEGESQKITGVKGYAESQDSTRPVADAVDGNTETFWHTLFGGGDVVFATNTNNNYYMDLGGYYEVDKFVYIPKQRPDQNGKITDFTLYGSMDSNYQTASWTEIGSASGWTYGSDGTGTNQQTLVLEQAATVRLLRIQVTGALTNSSSAGKNFISAAEFEAYGVPVEEEVIYMDAEKLNISYNAETGFNSIPWLYYAVNASGEKVDFTVEKNDGDLSDGISLTDNSSSTYRVGKYGINTNPDSTGYTEIGYGFVTPYEGKIKVEFTRDIFGSNNGNASEMYIKVNGEAKALYSKTASDRNATAEDKAINPKWNYVYLNDSGFGLQDAEVSAYDTVSITGKMGGSYNKNIWITPVITYTQLSSREMLSYYWDFYIDDLFYEQEAISEGKYDAITDYLFELPSFDEMSYIDCEKAVNHVDEMLAAPDSDYDWVYSDFGDGVQVDIYYGTEENLVIPESLGGKPVVRIGSYMLSDSQESSGTEFRSVTVPASVKYLAAGAFAWITTLEEVTLNEGLLSIGMDAFADCSALTEIIIPESVSTIDGGVFENCTNLKDVTILNGGVYLSRGFLGYDSDGNLIEGITLRGNKNSNVETYANENPHINFVAIDAEESPWITETLEDGTLKITGYTGEAQTVEIPAEIDGTAVTVIGESAFADTRVNNVTIPDTVTVIEREAFVNTYLFDITVPESVEEIGDYAIGYDFVNGAYSKVENFEIYGNFETAAQKYAESNSIEFVPLNDPKPIINGASHKVTHEGKAIVTFDIDSYSEIYELKILVNDDPFPYWLTGNIPLEMPVEAGQSYKLTVTAETTYGTVSDQFIYEFTVDEIPEPPYNPWIVEEISNVSGIVNEYDEDAQVLHLKSASGNGHTPISNPAALLVVNENIELGEEGSISFTLNRIDKNEYARFGVMINYGGNDSNLFIGYDSAGWFWQKFGNGSNNWYQGTRVAKPQAGDSVDIIIEWNGTTLTKVTANGENLFGDLPLDFSDISNAGTKVAFMAGTSGGATAEFTVAGFNYQGDSEPEYIMGDVDMDGELTVTDATLIQMYIAGMDNVSLNLELADMNNDGKITIADATIIQLIVAKKWSTV